MMLVIYDLFIFLSSITSVTEDDHDDNKWVDKKVNSSNFGRESPKRNKNKIVVGEK